MNPYSIRRPANHINYQRSGRESHKMHYVNMAKKLKESYPDDEFKTIYYHQGNNNPIPVERPITVVAAEALELLAGRQMEYQNELIELRQLAKASDTTLIEFTGELLNAVQQRIMNEMSIPIETRTELNGWISTIALDQEYMQYLLKK